MHNSFGKLSVKFLNLGRANLVQTLHYFLQTKEDRNEVFIHYHYFGPIMLNGLLYSESQIRHT